MKKLFSFILLLCLFVPCSFMLTACGEDDTNDVTSLKILLNGEELSLFECNWDNIDGNNEIINKDDISIIKVYEDTTEVPVFLRDCNIQFSDGTNNLTSLDFWESGETELTQPNTYTITISNSGVSADFDVKINKMNRTYGDVSLKNGTDTLGYGGFDNTYTLDWNYNQYKDLSLGGICEPEPYGDFRATVTHYFVDKTSYDNAEDKSAYYQLNKTLCYPDFTTMPIGSYYVFAEFSETNYYKAGISTSPLCLTLNARNFSPVKTSLNVTFDTNKLINNNALVENAESVNVEYNDIEEEINALFPQFENYGIEAFDKLRYYVFENNTWKKIDNTSSDIKVNAVNIGDKYYLVRYDLKSQKWLRVSTSAEVDINYIEVVKYTLLEDFKSQKYFEIPLYCEFYSGYLTNDFYYCTNVDEMFKLTLTIEKAKINSSNANLGTFTIEELGYDVRPAIKTAIDNTMIANNDENVKYLYTYPSCLDNDLAVGSYSASVHLVSNPNICWNLYQNVSFAVQNKDRVNPNVNVTNYFGYDKNILVDFEKEIRANLSFDSSKNELTLNISEDDITALSYTYILSFTDKIVSNGISENISNSSFEYFLTGSNVSEDNGSYIISDVGIATLTMNIYDSFNNKGTTEISFKFYNANSNDDCVDTQPIITINATADEDIIQSGNTISVDVGATISFEITVICSNCGSDVTANAEITTTIIEQLIGTEIECLDDCVFRFSDVGTFALKFQAEINGKQSDVRVVTIDVKRPTIHWLGEFDIPTYATRGETIYLPNVPASNNAQASVTYTTPGGVSQPAVTCVKDGVSCWTFTTSETTKGTYTITYTATTEYGSIQKEFRIKVGDNVAPTITIQNKDNLQQDIYYDGLNDIEYTIEVNKSDKTFVVKTKSNGKNIYNYDLGLVISDKDDSGTINSNMSWTNLTFDLTGNFVSNTSSTTTETTNTKKYKISGIGQCCLTLSVNDSYDNTSSLKIYFNVVDKLEQDEEEIEDIKTCKGYIVKANNIGQFNVEDLDIMPESNLKYTLLNSCNVDGILCETTSNVTMTNDVIQLSNYVDSAYVILKVTKLGDSTHLDYSQYIQIKIYR